MKPLSEVGLGCLVIQIHIQAVCVIRLELDNEVNLWISFKLCFLVNIFSNNCMMKNICFEANQKPRIQNLTQDI